MATQYFTIPFVSLPQEFYIDLNDKTVLIKNKWNSMIPAWEMSIYDGDTLEPLILCMPIIGGIDLLEQFAFTGLKGSMAVLTDGNSLSDPTLNNLGDESQVFYVVDIAE